MDSKVYARLFPHVLSKIKFEYINRSDSSPVKIVPLDMDEVRIINELQGNRSVDIIKISEPDSLHPFGIYHLKVNEATFSIFCAHHNVSFDYEGDMFQGKLNREAPMINCGLLTFNSATGILKFKGRQVELELDNHASKLLLLLMKNPGEVIHYIQIAEVLQPNWYRRGLDDKDVAGDIRHVKKQVTKILKNLGMSADELKVLIKTYKNIGYKLTVLG